MQETQIEIRVLPSLSAVDAEDWDACACPETADGGAPLDPFTTYRRLTEEHELPDQFVRAVDHCNNRGTMARVFVAVDRLPEFIGRPDDEGPEHRGLTLLGAEEESFERVADAQRYGRFSTSSRSS